MVSLVDLPTEILLLIFEMLQDSNVSATCLREIRLVHSKFEKLFSSKLLERLTVTVHNRGFLAFHGESVNLDLDLEDFVNNKSFKSQRSFVKSLVIQNMYTSYQSVVSSIISMSTLLTNLPNLIEIEMEVNCLKISIEDLRFVFQELEKARARRGILLKYIFGRVDKDYSFLDVIQGVTSLEISDNHDQHSTKTYQYLKDFWVRCIGLKELRLWTFKMPLAQLLLHIGGHIKPELEELSISGEMISPRRTPAYEYILTPDSLNVLRTIRGISVLGNVINDCNFWTYLGARPTALKRIFVQGMTQDLLNFLVSPIAAPNLTNLCINNIWAAGTPSHHRHMAEQFLEQILPRLSGSLHTFSFHTSVIFRHDISRDIVRMWDVFRPGRMVNTMPKLRVLNTFFLIDEIETPDLSNISDNVHETLKYIHNSFQKLPALKVSQLSLYIVDDEHVRTYVKIFLSELRKIECFKYFLRPRTRLRLFIMLLNQKNAKIFDETFFVTMDGRWLLENWYNLPVDNYYGLYSAFRYSCM